MTAKLESMKGWAARLATTLLLIVTATTTTSAVDFVTDVKLIGGTKSKAEQLKSNLENDGWTVIDKNLNYGCPDGDYIYLAYKTESNTDGFNYGYITDFVIRADPGTVDESITYSEHTYSLVPIQGGSTFLSSRGNLNSGAGGESIHLYYTRDNFADHRAVTGITINSSSTDAVSWYNLSSTASTTLPRPPLTARARRTTPTSSAARTTGKPLRQSCKMAMAMVSTSS